MSDRRPLSTSGAPQTGVESHSPKERARPKRPKKINARFRQRLLQGAIDENVDLLSDQPLGTTGRDRTRRRQRFKRWIFGSAVVGAAIAASAGLLTIRPTTATAREDVVISSRAMNQTSIPASVDGRLDVVLPALSAATLVRGTIPLGVRHVAIDPGHGGRDGGTSLQFGMLEKDLTLDLARRLSAVLSEVGIESTLTRNDDIEVSLADRAERANAARADLFVSIHVNWLPDRSARGFETYFLGPSDDPFLIDLASQENRESGYTVSDTRRLLNEIFADVRREESRRLAQSIQRSLFEVLHREHDQAHSRGVMSAPFVVLVATDMPAILAEVACLSNEREARLLAIPAYRQHIVEGLADGILQYAQIVGGTAPTQGDQG
jgi:N-acetylmuramoyl-L-alanine amidase